MKGRLSRLNSGEFEECGEDVNDEMLHSALKILFTCRIMYS